MPTTILKSGLRLNFGCDQTRLPGYVGVDIRPGGAADYVLPAWDTSPWAPDSVEEVYSRHMLEHLDPQEARRTLHAWHTILAPGGLLRLIVPDLAFHARQLLGEATSWSDDPDRNEVHAMAGFFGWRDEARGGNREDAHRWGYTEPSLGTLLSQVGYVTITRVTSGQDSEPWHLHITAHKPGETTTS